MIASINLVHPTPPPTQQEVDRIAAVVSDAFALLTEKK